jgi:hypothetical protein
MKEVVVEQLRLGGSVHIGGRYVSAHEVEQSFDAYPFIDMSSSEDKESLERFRKNSPNVVNHPLRGQWALPPRSAQLKR